MRLATGRRLFALLLLAAVLPLQAQWMLASNTDGALPDAPQPMPSSADPLPQQYPQSPESYKATPLRYAPRLAKYIDPDQHAVALTAKDKLELSGWEQIQPYSFATQILAAGWEQLLNSNPKYGTDKAGFGERLGAANIRQNSQAIFADGVFAAAFHQDPRYYRRGSGPILSRIWYSATRVVVIRSDSGNEQTNYSELVGYAGAAALTMTYYPAVSATWPNTAEGYGISLLGAALGNNVHEFAPDLLRLIRHPHRHS